MYYKMLLEFCNEIAEKPSIGKNYKGINPYLFGLIAKQHIIFCRVISENEVEIIRILHGRMDLKNRIAE